MLNICFFLSFAQRKKIDTRAFLGVGGTGDGRVGRGGGVSVFLYFISNDEDYVLSKFREAGTIYVFFF